MPKKWLISAGSQLLSRQQARKGSESTNRLLLSWQLPTTAKLPKVEISRAKRATVIHQ